MKFARWQHRLDVTQLVFGRVYENTAPGGEVCYVRLPCCVSQIKYDNHEVTDEETRSQGSIHSETALTPTARPASHAQLTTPHRHSPPRYHGQTDDVTTGGYENVAFTRGTGSIDGSVHFTGRLQSCPTRIKLEFHGSSCLV